MKRVYLFSVLSVLACAGAVAAPQQPDDTQAALPEAQSQNGIRYVCGGVGSDSAANLTQAAREHNLVLTFATKEGDYLADVNVNISDARGRPLLAATCDGPIMLVDVPKGGLYRVVAEVDGKQESGKVQIQAHGKGKRLALVWPRERADQS